MTTRSGLNYIEKDEIAETEELIPDEPTDKLSGPYTIIIPRDEMIYVTFHADPRTQTPETHGSTPNALLGRPLESGEYAALFTAAGLSEEELADLRSDEYSGVYRYENFVQFSAARDALIHDRLIAYEKKRWPHVRHYDYVMARLQVANAGYLSGNADVPWPPKFSVSQTPPPRPLEP